jgi:myosin heavy subunit
MIVGAEVWSKIDDSDVWKASIVQGIGSTDEISGKLEVQVITGNGDTFVVKTKCEENKHDDYQSIKLRNSVSLDKYFRPELLLLPIINEPEIVECLKFCHARGKRSQCFGRFVISLNHFDKTNFNPLVYKSYYQEKNPNQDILNSLELDLPHTLYNTYLKAIEPEIRSGQALIMLGESGSGKSVCVRDICYHLGLLASQGFHSCQNPPTLFAPDTKFFDHLNLITECFGQAQTNLNATSSRFSSSIRLSFDPQSGHLSGFVLRCFHLEMGRTVTQAHGETNYKAFFAVFDDIYFAAQALSKFGIDNLSLFRYTSVRPRATPLPGKSSYKGLVAALEDLAGLTKSQLNTQVFGILAAILHLGQVDMEEVDSYGDISTAFSSGNLTQIQMIAITFRF